MNGSTLKDFRLLKSQTGQYLWQPSLLLEAPDTLVGIPVYQSVDIPPAPSKLPVIAIADFKKAYKILDSRGIRVLETLIRINLMFSFLSLSVSAERL